MEKKIKEVVERMGYECLQVVLKGGKRKRLVVVIDTPGGVRVDDCVRVSRELSVILDVEDPIPGSYDLEVTSPGVERPIYSPDEYPRFVGKGMAVYTDEGVIKGKLLECNEQTITLKTSKEERTIFLETIKRAHLLGPWEEVS